MLLHSLKCNKNKLVFVFLIIIFSLFSCLCALSFSSILCLVWLHLLLTGGVFSSRLVPHLVPSLLSSIFYRLFILVTSLPESTLDRSSSFSGKAVALSVWCALKAGATHQPRWVNVSCRNSRNPEVMVESAFSAKHSPWHLFCGTFGSYCLALLLDLGRLCAEESSGLCQ